jgi:hypothetical protein
VALKILGPVVGFIAKLIGRLIAGAINALGGFVRFFTKTIPDAVKTTMDFFKGIADTLGPIFKPIFNLITTPFRLAFAAIAKLWNATIGGLEFKLPDWLPPPLGGKGISIPKLPENIPALANGGIVTKPTLALIGEAGPEAVVPLSRGRGPGNVYNITVSGALDPEAVARQIQRILRDSERRAGAY